VNIVFNIHNRRSNTATQKVIELISSLSKNDSNINYYLFCTSDNNKLFVKKEVHKKIVIYEFPDMLFGKLRQGVDIYNSLIRIYYLSKKINYDILHSVDARPTIFFSSLFSKFFLKKILVLSWWDYVGKGGIFDQKFGIFFSNSFGLILQKMDIFLRKKADANLVVNEDLLKKVNKINKSSINKLIRVGSNEIKSTIEIENKLNIYKNSIFYCGALTHDEEKLLIDVANHIANIRPEIKLVTAGNNITNNQNIIGLGFLRNFDDIIHLIRISKIVLLPFNNTSHNNNRWPSKISDFAMEGKAIISTPINLLKNISYPFCIFTKNFSYQSIGDTIIETYDNDSKIEKYENLSKSFFENELCNKKISQMINDIYRNCQNS
tara:strand:- start:827 stop:1960 length:1134 start_codon:yes stop_codon:yes gene_type:complete